jgi:hypothetical protein
MSWGISLAKRCSIVNSAMYPEAFRPGPILVVDMPGVGHRFIRLQRHRAPISPITKREIPRSREHVEQSFGSNLPCH